LLPTLSLNNYVITVHYTVDPLIYLQVSWLNEHSEVKRKKLEIKLESDDANDNFSFPETMRRDKRGEEAGRFVSNRYSFHSCTHTHARVRMHTHARIHAHLDIIFPQYKLKQH
jgi:hypothetical protein